jgi:hypothetical protein
MSGNAQGAVSQEKEYLGMSDEAFLGIDLNDLESSDVEDDNGYTDGSDLAAPRGEAGSGDDRDDAGEETETEDSEASLAGEAQETDDAGDVDQEVDGETDEDTNEPAADKNESDSEDEQNTDADTDEQASDSADTNTDQPVDPKTFYEQVTAEFRANGKPMKVDKPEDVVRLMQMGANYNRKMAALKPNLKIMKMLEKHELLDEGKLGFLIDLNQKNPAAIAKLLADSEIDPMDFNLDQGAQYKASDYSVDDREIALDEVVEELKESPTYAKTINLVTQKWDDASKQTVANEPQLLKILDGHMASGVYDRISTEVEQERVFGRLNGMSDLEAYTFVGDAIAARGGFDDLKGNSQPSTPRTTAKPDSTSPQRKVEDQQRRNKRRAASPSKATAPASKDETGFNPLGMSDEEYLKQFDAKFL